MSERLNGLGAERLRRETQLKQMLAAHAGLRAELGDVPATAVTAEETLSDLTRAHMEAVLRAVDELTRAKAERGREVAELLPALSALCTEMGEPVPQCDPRSVLASVLAGLRSERQRLLALRAARIDRLNANRQTAATLHAQLGLPREQLDAFLAATAAPTDACLRTCEAELARLRELKRANTDKLIAQATERMRALWDELGLPDAKRQLPAECVQLQQHMAGADGGPASIDEATVERVLGVCEAETERLESLLREVRPIVQMVERREQIIREREIFEQQAHDQTRLFQRDPGRLLREEKQRAVFERQLPKLEQQLRQKLSEWVEMHGEPFVYNREDYLAKMTAYDAHRKQELEEEKRRKEREKLERKLGKTAAVTGNVGSALACAMDTTQTPARKTRAATALKTPAGAAKTRLGATLTAGVVDTATKKRRGKALQQQQQAAEREPLSPITNTMDSPRRAKQQKTAAIGATHLTPQEADVTM